MESGSPNWAEESKVGVWDFYSSWKLGRRESQEGGRLRRGAPKSTYTLPSVLQLTPELGMCRVRCREPREKHQLEGCLVLRGGAWSSIPTQLEGCGKHLRLSIETTEGTP